MFAPRLSEPALLVFDASPSAVALAGLLEAAERSVLWTPLRKTDQPWVARAAALVAEATGARVVEAPQAAATLAQLREATREAALALLAADAALQHGLPTALLPWTLGGQGAHAVSQAVDRVGLVSALLQLGPEAGTDRPLRVEAPLADLTPAQTAALLREAALPAEAVVVCDQRPPPGCGACPACVLWRKAREAADGFSPQEALPLAQEEGAAGA